jgi:hypothetical protein
MNRLFALSAFALSLIVFACGTPIEPTNSSLVAEGEGEGEGEEGEGEEGEGEEGEGEEGEGEEGEGDEELECESEVIDAPSSASCDAATLTCFDGCGDEDEACFDDCLAADSGGEDCSDCLDDAYLSCANDAGCQPEFDAIVCCSYSCADADADECYTDTCAGESNAYESCLEGHEQCYDADAVCFAAE